MKSDLEALLGPLRARFEAVAHAALHPGRSARILLNDVPIGWIGELHPRLQQKYELPASVQVFELEVEPLLERGVPVYQEVSNYPPMLRDLSVLVKENTPVQALLDGMNRAKQAQIRSIRLFDQYRGKGVPEGEKSLAFRVVMQDTSRTLTDEEADAIKAGLLQVLTANFGAKLRA
jgi:phenylalanyl-tRNA synthetase beta chain